MDKLLEFAKSLDEAIEWLEKSQSDLADYLYPNSDPHHNWGSDPQAEETVERLREACKAVNAVREPLASRIASHEQLKQEQEKWNPN